MVEAAVSMLVQANLPSCLWPFAVKHAIYVRNRVPHSSTAKTPYSVFVGEAPSLKYLRVFGCKAYILRVPEATKFEPRAVEGVHLETLDHGVYRILVIDENGIPRITESRHVTFDEFAFPGAHVLEDFMNDECESDDTFESSDCDAKSSESSEISISETFITEDVNDDKNIDDATPILENPSNNSSYDERDDENIDDVDNNTAYGSDDDIDCEQEVPPQNDPSHETEQHHRRYPSRERRKPPAWYVATSVDTQSDVSITTSDEPTLREVLNATPEERDLWMSAINDEFNSLESKDTWYQDDYPTSQPLPTHPVLKIKRKSDGSLERFKARVVTGGNFQKYGENYKETHAPVVSFALVRIFLYLTLCLGLSVGQVDIKTAFLNGELSDSVWVMSPRGIPGIKSQCYRLKKAMYGLKQAHLARYTKLCSDLNRIRFFELPSAPCVFLRERPSGQKEYILAYVDDLLILAHTVAAKDTITEELKTLYTLRVAEKVDLFLGVKLSWTMNGNGKFLALKMCQSLYTKSILRRFGLHNSKPARTPMVESF